MPTRTKTPSAPSLEQLRALARQDRGTPQALADAAEMSFGRIDRALLIPIERIAPMKDNPRQTFRHLDELAESIASEGVIQPLIIRRDPERAGYYMTVAGARRVMAANILRGHEDPDVRGRVALLPCIVAEESDDRALAKALAENAAREDLTRGEMMDAVLRLEREYGWSGNRISKAIGRNQGDVAEMLRVAKDPELSELVREELLSATAAGMVTRLPPETRPEVLAEIRAGRIRSRDDIKAVNPKRRARRAQASAADGVNVERVNDVVTPPEPSESVNDVVNLGEHGATDRVPGAPAAASAQAGSRAREDRRPASKPSPLERRAEEVRQATAHASALRAIVEPHPLIGWEPEVRSHLDAVYESREKLAGWRATDAAVSGEDWRAFLTWADERFDAMMPHARSAGDNMENREIADRIREKLDCLFRDD